MHGWIVPYADHRMDTAVNTGRTVVVPKCTNSVSFRMSLRGISVSQRDAFRAPTTARSIFATFTLTVAVFLTDAWVAYNMKDAKSGGDKGPAQDKFEIVKDAPLADTPKKKGAGRFRSFLTRLVSTVLMIAGFILIIYMGHVPLVALIFFIQLCMVRELFEISREAQREKELPGFRAQQWYFFGVATFFFYLRFIKNNLLQEITSDAKLSSFGWLLRHHSLWAYCLYTAGLIYFVLSLKKGVYLYQFGQYAWTHMILMVVFVPSSFFVSNIFQGLIWFLLPCSLIITNDITAYLAGFFFGRTPLIKLSPKKTWEGFIGGFLGTLALSYVLTKLFIQFDWMICPRRDLSMGSLVCDRSETFIADTYSLRDMKTVLPGSWLEILDLLSTKMPPTVVDVLLDSQFQFEPMIVHGAVFSFFASVIAPFGGFFASGFKRAFKVKDFAAIIPGHGGMTDRMDCQMLMAVFSYLYYFTFVRESLIDVGSVLDMALKLDEAHQLELFGKLGNYLVGKGMLQENLCPSLSDIISSSNGR